MDARNATDAPVRRWHVALLGAAAAVGALWLASPAGAQAAPTEDAPDISHAAEECIEILEDGGTAEECQQAPDPFLPPVEEIVWSVVGFSVVGFFGWKWGRPAIRNALSARTERIRSELATAEQARLDAEQIHAEYQTQFFGAADEVEAIVRAGREQAVRLRIEMARTMETELTATRERAITDIESMRTQALADVRAEAGLLVSGLTEHLVRANLDPGVQAALIDDYIESLGRQN